MPKGNKRLERARQLKGKVEDFAREYNEKVARGEVTFPERTPEHLEMLKQADLEGERLAKEHLQFYDPFEIIRYEGGIPIRRIDLYRF